MNECRIRAFKTDYYVNKYIYFIIKYGITTL